MEERKLVIAVFLTNINVIPTSAPVFDDIVWGYAVPLAIPLLLLNANIFKIWRETGKILVIFLIGAAGTFTEHILGKPVCMDNQYFPDICFMF